MKKIYLIIAIMFALAVVPQMGLATTTDVMIDGVEISPMRPVVGQSVTITISGRYFGNVALTDSSIIGSVGFFHNDFKTNATAVLSPVPSVSSPFTSGSYFTYVIRGNFTGSGTKSLVFDVDNSNLLAETNESNNSYTKVVTVLSDGDLVKVGNRPEIYIVKSDGAKHSFVNGPTFWSYYTGSWSQLYRDGVAVYIKNISQTEFDQLQYGSHMTIKSGSKLIKFKSGSQIFAVYNGNKIKSVTDSEAANWYANSSWRKTVIIIQDNFASDYSQDDYNFTDSDSDGVSNVDETNIYKTNVNSADTDGDGYRDGWEIINGFNPNGPGRL